MKKLIYILGVFTLLQITGCKSIVKDYSASELDNLTISLNGVGQINKGTQMRVYEELIWTCPKIIGRLSVSVNNRVASSKLELFGRYYRKDSAINTRGVAQFSKAIHDNTLNVKIDLKRQAAKFNIAKSSDVNGGCASGWFDLSQ